MTQKNVSEIHGCERVRFSVPENQLVALLLARSSESHAGVTTLDKRGNVSALSYAELHAKAAQLCAGLQSAGLRPGDRLVLQLSDALDVMVGFWGCILAGVVPVPLNTAPFYDRHNSQTDRLVSAVVSFRCRAVLTSPELCEPITALLGAVETTTPGVFNTRVVNIADCRAVTTAPSIHKPAPDDPAAMFLTSGSTGAAKGVVQTHAAMLAMADATIQMNGFTSADVTLNWMSLDHAGSLVFLGVMPLALGAPQVHVPIDYVLKDPARWLDLIETWGASITWAPNFVFSLLLDRQEQLQSRRWDLSSMRFMVNAGEAVVSATARRFITLLQQFGLPEAALRPAFGMVETCSGITWSTGFRLQDTSDADTFVSLGPVIPGAAMKIVDEAGATVAEGVEGRLLLKGASVFNGYDGEDPSNVGLLTDGWLVTGDLAYIKAGELHVTGREKDMVIINGNNHYCHEIEAIVGKFPAIASDCVAAVGVRSADENTESLVIFYALANRAAAGSDGDLEKSVRSEVARLAGLAPRALVALRPEEFPRTEIGKIKRNLLKRRYENGEIDQSAATRMNARHIDEAEAHDSEAFRALVAGISAIWQRALRLESVGLDETFFELGGSSLLAIQVQHELELLLGREVSMVELFDTPSIRAMAEHFSGRRESSDRTDTAPSTQPGTRTSQSGDIAVIGVACRFPGAHGPEAFWRVLEEGVETLTFFTAEEAIAAGVPYERAHDPAQVNVAPVLDDVEGCDLDFWKYAKREAELLDPQQRVFLETAWEAFEDAGYVPGSALGKVGVYASAATNTYLQNNVYANSAWVEENGGNLLTVNSVPGFNVMVANDKDYLPTRVSYKLDLTGPSMGIQTACSSTLVAVHEAARALREGECDMAIAGGCALMLPQHAGHYYEEGMINSPDGHCRAYDREAKGTIFGSGSGAVLLKRLDRALADGDAIYAVIKGSAVINDGGQKMGFTAPSMLGEYRAISQAIENAGIDADSIGFVEGHGTGTPIGDPIEVQALTKAFRHSTQRSGYCALGSVKTNIGHMGIASGIAGFIKAVLALHHKTLPATLHFTEANPAIGFSTTPFYVSNRTREWEAGTNPRRAGVNSLGIGGTNVHVILEEAPLQAPVETLRDVYVLPVSAGSAAALRDKLAAIAEFVARHPEVALADLAFTHQRGRLAMACRRAIVFSDRDELQFQLSEIGNVAANTELTNAGSRIVFMFTGQGSQYAGMGRELHGTHQAFREAFDACANLFAPHREHSLRDLILADSDDSTAQALLNQTQYTQPALFCVQVALVQLYRQLGIRPEIIVGHSIGEVAGVWAAGGLSLADAVVLVEARSRLMQAVTQSGAMASVKAHVDVVRELLKKAGGDCEIAACNSPLDTTITGDADAIASACDYLQQQDIRVTALTVSHAFHSRHMETLQREFAKAIATLEFRKTLIPVIGNLDAVALDHEKLGADYWTAQLRAPVQFMQGLQRALAAGGNCFIEIGPAAILCGLGRALESAGLEQWVPDLQGIPTLHWIPSLRKGQPDTRVLANAIATLFTTGHTLDWSGSSAFDGHRTHLPTYAWQRQRCWIEPDPKRASVASGDPLRARPLVLPRLGQQLYTFDYAIATIPVLKQHRVFGMVVPPAALYVSQLLHTAADFAGQQRVELSDVNFIAPMHLSRAGSDTGTRTVQILYGSGSPVTRIELSSQPTELRLSGTSAGSDSRAVQIHVTAELLSDAPGTAAAVDIEALRRRCSEPLAPQLIEAHMAAMEVELGESFHCFRSIHRGQNEALALLDVPRTTTARIGQGIPAGLIDCHWQTMLAALPVLPAATIVPARIDALVSHTDRLPDQVWAHALIHRQSSTLIIATVTLLSASGQVLLESRGIEFRVVAANSFRQTNALRDVASLPRLFSRRWQTLPAVERTTVAARVWLAGNADDVKVLAAQLRSAGVEPLLVTNPNSAIGIDSPKEPLQLVYVDRVTDIDDAESAASGMESCIALNRFLASFESGSSAIEQIVILTALTESHEADFSMASPVTPSAALSIASRSALMSQAVAISHELLDWNVLAVEMDQEQSSISRLLDFLETTVDSGLRLRIKAGVAHTLKADLVAADSEEISFTPDKLQVITGGLGGLGLLTAQWMFQRGARHLLLVGRSAPSKNAEAVIAALREQGAKIETQRCDVSQQDQVFALAAKAAQLALVETIIHAAGARNDGFIGSLQDEHFSALAQGKAKAAAILHEAFTALKPRHTVYYSSIAAWLGAAGQSNYCGANAALDSLAGQYSVEGCHTISVAWGPWDQAGMTAALSESHLARIVSTGYSFLNADSAFKLLGRFLAAPDANGIAILAADFDRLAALPGAADFWPASMRVATRQDSVTTTTTTTIPSLPVTAVRTRLPVLAGELLALNQKAASELLQDHLARLVADMTSPGSKECFDFDKGFLDLGIDSLAALEMRKKLESALGLKLKSTLILDYPNIAVMARELLNQLQKTYGSEVRSPDISAKAKPDRADLLRQLANEIDFQE